MGAHKHKLNKVVRLTFNNLTREMLTEVEVFLFTAKAFVDSPDKEKSLDLAFEKMRNRLFDLGGEEKRRLLRYLAGWDVKQVSKDLDWVEYGDRLDD